MKNEITYEWCFEETGDCVDGDYEILDHTNATKLEDLRNIIRI